MTSAMSSICSGPRGGVAGGGAQVDVPEPRGDLVDGDAGLEAVRRPVGPQRVRVAESLGDAGGEAGPVEDPVHGDGGEGEGLFVAVAADPDEQRLLIT